MGIIIQGNVNGNVIERVEAGTTVIGVEQRSVCLEWSNKAQIDQLLVELQELKKELINEKGKELVCSEIDIAITAIQEKDESKLKRAFQVLGRECLNIIEGITGSVLATLIMNG